jgi:hypothetical protein
MLLHHRRAAESALGHNVGGNDLMGVICTNLPVDLAGKGILMQLSLPRIAKLLQMRALI